MPYKSINTYRYASLEKSTMVTAAQQGNHKVSLSTITHKSSRNNND